jgi:hypothetical protein
MSASAEPDNPEYIAYKTGGELGARIFADYLARNELHVRVVAMLRACDKQELAKTIDDKLPDKMFEKPIFALSDEGKITSLATMLHTQTVARAMLVGYMAGMERAAKLQVTNSDRARESIYEVAMEMAKDLKLLK